MVMRRIIPVLLLALLPTLLAAAEPRQAYVGAARLYSLERVTVVYPAAGGEDVDTNRISAERRASFLLHEHGMEAAVAADSEVDEESLSGNLLLLGWGNRLLGKKGAPTPIRKAAGDRLFLGSIRIAAGDELLFAHTSPFNPDSQLIFWSKIDLEADRSFVLPFLGSDWAVYRDFFILEQGMFAKNSAWPPSRNPEAEMNRREQLRDLPARESSTHYTLHYAKALLDADLAAAILATREKALGEVIAELGAPPEEFRIALFIYPTGERKEELTGVPTNAHSFASRRQSHMTLRQARSGDPGQEVLLLAAALFGPCRSTALSEGLSFLLRDHLGERSLPAHAAQMIESDNLPTIGDLLDEDALRTMNRRQALPAIGLLTDWLRQRGEFSKIWKEQELRAEDIAGALDIAPAALDGAFTQYVAALARDAGGELAFRQALGEAQLCYDRGDTTGMAEAMLLAAEIRPDDPETLYKLALALKQSGDPAGAERSLLHLVELEIEPAGSRYLIFGHYQLGKLYAEQGKEKRARAQFERVLGLPDEYEAHRKAREALAAL
jgi:TolA-binding protein